MSSIQNNSTPAQVAAQNSNTDSLIKSTQGSIQTMASTVRGATQQVAALSEKVTTSFKALVANPSDKKLQKTLATDLAALNAANDDLTDVSKQLQQLLESLPALIAQAKSKDDSMAKSQESAADSAQQQKEMQAAQKSLDDAGEALNAGRAAASSGASKLSQTQSGSSDAYNASARGASASSSSDDLEEKLGTGKTGGALGSSSTSASGSAVDAKSILSANGIPSSLAYVKDSANEKRIRAALGDALFDSLLSALSGGDDAKKQDGSSGKSKQSVGTAKSSGVGGALGASNAGTASTYTNSIGADGSIVANASGQDSVGGDLGALSDADTVNNDPQAAVDPSALSPMEIMLLVMLEATDELNQEMRGMANELQKATNAKSKLREELNDINKGIVYATGDGNMSKVQAQKNATAKLEAQNVQNKLDTIGDDTQMMQLRLQNLMQMQQQFVQGVSNISKSLNDTSMAVLRHIGS